MHFAAKKANKNTNNNNNFDNNNNNYYNSRGVTLVCQGSGEAGRFPIIPGPVWFVSATLFILMQMVLVQMWKILPTTVGHNVTRPHREGLTVVG